MNEENKQSPMSELTRKQVESLIEGLADKQGTAMRKLFNDYHGGDKSCSACDSFYKSMCSIFPPPPVYINDCLAKCSQRKEADHETYAEVVRLWAKCGFKKSLQQIVEDSGWECKSCGSRDFIRIYCCANNKGKKGKPETLGQLADKNARELLDFIYSLKITNE